MQAGDTKIDFVGRQNVGIQAKHYKLIAGKDGVISFTEFLNQFNSFKANLMNNKQYI